MGESSIFAHSSSRVRIHATYEPFFSTVIDWAGVIVSFQVGHRRRILVSVAGGRDGVANRLGKVKQQPANSSDNSKVNRELSAGKSQEGGNA